jgi:polysaccharide pyruvyl transferase WcaK-like protein
MHSFVVGNDDREFNRNFIFNYLSARNVDYEIKPASVDEIIKAMLDSKLSICMRFHSVLFAHTLGVNFLALDYTDSGKIKGFLADNNSLNKRVTIQDLADENFDSWDSIIRELFNENSPS